jgi:hypothetical protein
MITKRFPPAPLQNRLAFSCSSGRRKRIAARLLGLILLVSACSMAIASKDKAPQPLGKAHAHNDYAHMRPLWDALDHGFTGVEADIHLVGKKLLVGHDAKDLRQDLTLESMYLAPLRKRVKANQGRVFPGGPMQILLIDLKTEAVPTYRVLRRVLKSYADMLTVFGPQGKKEGAILVILTGNRPYEVLKEEKTRYAAMDGRLTDLSSVDPVDLIPMISDNWEKNFTWRGNGPMPGEERSRLLDILSRAHSKGRWLRFWATPDKLSAEREAVWQELDHAGVDFLNSDDLPALQQFLLKGRDTSSGKSLRTP